MSPASTPSFGSGGTVEPGVVAPGADEPGVTPPFGTVGRGETATGSEPESVTFRMTVVTAKPVANAATTRPTISPGNRLRSCRGGSLAGSGRGATSTGGSGAIVSRSGSA